MLWYNHSFKQSSYWFKLDQGFLFLSWSFLFSMVNFFTMESALTGKYFASCPIVNAHSIKTKLSQANHEMLNPLLILTLTLIHITILSSWPWPYLLAELDAVLKLNFEIVHIPRCVEALPDFLTDEGQGLLGLGFV